MLRPCRGRPERAVRRARRAETRGPQGVGRVRAHMTTGRGRRTTAAATLPAHAAPPPRPQAARTPPSDDGCHWSRPPGGAAAGSRRNTGARASVTTPWAAGGRRAPACTGAHRRVRCMAEAGAPPPRTGFPPLHRPSPRAFAVLSPVRSARFRARTPEGRPTGHTAHPASAGSPTRPCRSRRSRGGAGAVVVRRRPPLGTPVTLGRSWPESTAHGSGTGARQWSLLTALTVVFLNAFTGAFPKFPI